MNDQAGNALIYALLLILPLSALLARRVPIGNTLKMTLVWIAIFVIGLLLVAQRDRIRPYWERARDALLGSNQQVSGTAVRIAMDADGHFRAQAVGGSRGPRSSSSQSQPMINIIYIIALLDCWSGGHSR